MFHNGPDIDAGTDEKQDIYFYCTSIITHGQYPQGQMYCVMEWSFITCGVKDLGG